MTTLEVVGLVLQTPRYVWAAESSRRIPVNWLRLPTWRGG